MKKKILKMAAAVTAFILIGIILFITNSLVGNPVSKALAQKNVKKYVEENYKNLNLEIGETNYNFKSSNYYTFVQSKDSIDTNFSIFSGINGKVIMDSYEDNVLSYWNTYIRLDEDYRNIVEPLIENNLEYNFDMVIAGLDKLDKDSEKLTLDMKFDINDIPLDEYVTVYLYTDNLTWENVAETALCLDNFLKEHNLNIEKYTVVLKPTSEIEEKKGEYWGVYDFPKNLLKSENLPKVMEEHFNNWNEEGEKIKNSEINK